MTEEMQINEIAREICHLYNECETCQICNEKYPTEDGELCYFQCMAKEIITHDYRKVKRGEWDEDGVCKQCSQCGDDVARYDEYGIYQKFDFCPHCGADMRKEGEEN